MNSISQDDGSPALAVGIVVALTGLAFYLGRRSSSKFEKREQMANRLVEFFEGDDLIRAKTDFNRLADHYTEEQALDIVLYRGRVHEYY